MTTALAERRRSDRIWLTIQLCGGGVDSNGRTFDCEARAINLGRHGARLQIHQSLNVGQAVHLKSPTEDEALDFRVATAYVLPGGKNGEYGVECLDIKANFWRIDFPASDSDGPVDGKVLVECRKCQTIALLPMTLSEVEALRAMGLVGKQCSHCNSISLWRYAQVGTPPHRPCKPAEIAKARCSADVLNDPNTHAKELVERGHRRLYMLVPFGLRDTEGGEEMARTENISRSGFCFISEKSYQPGEPVLAIFPNDSVAPSTELPAQIVRAQNIEGSDRKIYGVAYSQD